MKIVKKIFFLSNAEGWLVPYQLTKKGQTNLKKKKKMNKDIITSILK